MTYVIPHEDNSVKLPFAHQPDSPSREAVNFLRTREGLEA
jgi:hypothetical protein